MLRLAKYITTDSSFTFAGRYYGDVVLDSRNEQLGLSTWWCANNRLVTLSDDEDLVILYPA